MTCRRFVGQALLRHVPTHLQPLVPGRLEVCHHRPDSGLALRHSKNHQQIIPMFLDPGFDEGPALDDLLLEAQIFHEQAVI